MRLEHKFYSILVIHYSYLCLLICCRFIILGRLEIEGKGKIWRQDQKVRLQHVDTKGYLHSHDKKYQRIAGGQQEVKYSLAFFRSLFGLFLDTSLFFRLKFKLIFYQHLALKRFSNSFLLIGQLSIIDPIVIEVLD